MTREVLSHYEVLERVGGGGMGEVFRARDTRLGRDVALKFLAPNRVPDAASRDRLIREARAASKLDHPNVCTVYEIDEAADGELFIAMAYCRGGTLEQRLAKTAPPAEEVVAIAVQVADGLAAAHAAGVVHRDVKPGNVMVSEDGRVKLVDFGLATGSTEHVTRHGEAAGTTAYMAPEQIRGDVVDERADVWGFGVVLYQMLTGRLPFAAEYDQAVMFRILHDDPDPLDVDLPSGYDGLAGIVGDCLSKDPERRPRSMGEVAMRLHELGPGADERSRRPGGIQDVMAAVRARPLPGALAGTGVLALLAVVVFLALRPGLPQEKYVAVLPLAAIGADESDVILADGLSATLTNKLAQLAAYTDDAFWVVPHTEVLIRSVTSPSAARRVFGATLALEGSLVRMPSGVRLALSLTDTRTLRTLRAIDFESSEGEMRLLQDEAALRLADVMHVQLRPESAGVVQAGRTDDREAFELYVRARGFLDRYERKDNLEAAVSLLQQAVVIDSRFGGAYAALGEANWRLYEATRDEIYVPLAQRHLERALAIDERIASAHIALARLHAGTGRNDEALGVIDRIVALEPANAEAFLVLGSIEGQRGEFDAAEAAYRRAVELRPGYWGGYSHLGVFYYWRGRYEEAERAWVTAAQLTPDNPRVHNNLGALMYRLQRFEEAAEYFENSIALHPTDDAFVNLGTLYSTELEDPARAAETYRRAIALEDGNYRTWYYLTNALGQLGASEEQAEARGEAIRRAERQLQLNPNDERAMVELAAMYVSSGETQRATELLRAAGSRTLHDVELKYLVAESYERLGERPMAVAWLCRAVSGGYSLASIERSRQFDSLRHSDDYDTVRACARE